MHNLRQTTYTDILRVHQTQGNWWTGFDVTHTTTDQLQTMKHLTGGHYLEKIETSEGERYTFFKSHSNELSWKWIKRTPPEKEANFSMYDM